MGTPLLCKILRAWTSEPLWTATTTSIAALACVPDKALLLVKAALNYLTTSGPVLKSTLGGGVKLAIRYVWATNSPLSFEARAGNQTRKALDTGQEFRVTLLCALSF